MTRVDVADYLRALFNVYSIVVVAWIVAQFVFAMGVSMPYSRPANAVLDFLRDCTEPFLRIFRRLGLRFGPLDLSPLIALFALALVAKIVVAAVDPRV